MSEEKIYQPKWEEAKERQARRDKHRHHSHHSSYSDKRARWWGGRVLMRDKQAYYGLMVLIIGVLGYGAYKLTMEFVNEWRAMPHDDPGTEMIVDELGIRKVAEQDALLYGDSIAQQLHVDSIQHTIKIDMRAPYRPPRKEDTWYITQHEWKDIWRQWKRKRYERKLEKEKQ